VTSDDPSPLADLDRWERHLCAPVTGRKVICAFDVLAAMTRQVAQLRRWGARRPLLLADGIGTGPVPLETEADIMLLPPPDPGTLTAQVRSRIDLGSRVGPEVARRVREYDADGTAWWWNPPVSPNEPLLGRRVLGGRPTSQIRLEDKLLLDDLLAAAGVRQPPGVVADATYDALMTASDYIRSRSGADAVVWAGDSRDGINGAGDYIRMVATDEHAAEGVEFFGSRCDRVRVSPLYAGVPCSIHAVVLPDGVVTLRPVELVNLLDAATGRFTFAGMGTSWDPPAADRAEMRATAAAIARHLRDHHRLRGGLGVDGVLTAEGFRVTEVNPRFSGGLTRLSRAAPSLHLDLVQLNALLDRDIARPAADLEAEALALLDEHRVVDVMATSARVQAQETVHVAVAIGETGFEPVNDDAPDAVGTVLGGPSSVGTFVRLTADEPLVRRGARCAPLAVLLLDLADRQWDTGFGALQMAADVRPVTAAPGGRGDAGQ
jgi:hypothetical protein